jgi:hypothetical protein
LRKFTLWFVAAAILSGCSHSEDYGELTDYIEVSPVEDTYDALQNQEEMSIQDALKEISFDHKRINEETLPFDVKEKSARVTGTKENSRLIEMAYEGIGHTLVFYVENNVKFKQDPSLEYEEVVLEDGRIAMYAEDGNSHDITWVEGDVNYLMHLSYKEEAAETPERFSKEDVVQLVDGL